MPPEIVIPIVLLLMLLAGGMAIRKALKERDTAFAGQTSSEQGSRKASGRQAKTAERWYRETYGDGPVEILETPSESERFHCLTLTGPTTPDGTHLVVMRDGTVDAAHHAGAVAAERWYREAYGARGKLTLSSVLADGYWRIYVSSPRRQETLESIVWPDGTLDQAHLKGVAASIEWCQKEYRPTEQVSTLTMYDAKRDVWYVDLFYDEDKPSVELMMLRDGSINWQHREIVAAAERWYHTQHGTSGPLETICKLGDRGWDVTICLFESDDEIDLLVSDSGEVTRKR